MPGVDYPNNEVEFLMDGRDVFMAIRDGLRWVAASNAPDATTYARLAFWALSLETNLGGGAILRDELQAVANAGHEVRIILWLPGFVARFQHENHARAHERVKEELEAGNPYANGGTISVLLEKHQSLIPGQSVHQKLAVFARTGLPRRAIVSGLNLSNWYIDDQTHPGGMGGDNGYIHDTAVLVRGSAAAGVDAVWLGRWNREQWRSNRLPANPTVEPAFPAVGGHSVDVTLAQTDSTGWFRVTDIQALLLEHIARARDYVYLEGYALSDPAIVSALARRQRVNPGLRIIIVVPQPRTGGRRNGPIAPYDYLQFFTYVKLSMTSCTSVTFGGEGGPLVVPRDRRNPWEVSESWNFWSTMRSVTSTVYNGWMQYDAIVFDHPVTGAVTSRRILDVTDITDPGVRLYSPGHVSGVLGARTWSPIYVHSKLALVDDEIAVIGSANFTYRSMVYDGELSVFISNAAVVRGIRQTLFAHYNMGDPANWEGDAATNAQDLANGTIAPGTAILPLGLDDFSTEVPPLSSGNATWY